MLKNYKIRYVSSDGAELNLSGGGIDANGESLPSWEFEASTLNGVVVGMSRRLPEYEISVAVFAKTDRDGIEARNALYEIPASDRAALTPGRLCFNDWYIRGYMTGATPANYWQTPRAAQYVLRFVATEPLWTREVTSDFMPKAGGGVDYPLDFAFDYSSSMSADVIANENYAPSHVRLTVQGPAQNPSVTIGGNAYKVNTTVGSGEYLEIDGVGKTVLVVESDGTRRNVFDKRDGSQAVGSGHYVFEKIPAGESPVVYTNGLVFSVTVVEQRAEPRWA